MEKTNRRVVVGMIDNTGFEQDNGNYLGFGKCYEGATFGKRGISPTLRACMCHGSVPCVVKDKMIIRKEREK